MNAKNICGILPLFRVNRNMTAYASEKPGNVKKVSLMNLIGLFSQNSTASIEIRLPIFLKGHFFKKAVIKGRLLEM